MPSANDQEVFRVIDSEMDTPLSVTLAIWYCGQVSETKRMNAFKARLVQTPCITVKQYEKTLLQDSLSFLFGQRIFTPLYRLTK
jgi:hypothetical protein